MRQTFGIIGLGLYMAVLLLCLAAEIAFQTGKPALACRLNPFVSRYHQSVFDGSKPKDIPSIQKAIQLEPLNPLYHMIYGLELLSHHNTRTRASDTIAFTEIKRAYQLKPYSKTYKKAYEKYAKPSIL